MLLASNLSGLISFNKAAIMRRAFQIGRFALQLCRTAADRNQQLSRNLRKAWAEAKREAAAIAARVEEAARDRVALAARAAQSVALAASMGDAAAIRQAIASEQYRDRVDLARIDRLTAALSTFGA